MINTEEIERVNSIISIQNDIIVSYKLYLNYIKNDEQRLAKYMKGQIKDFEDNLKRIKSKRLALILLNE